MVHFRFAHNGYHVNVLDWGMLVSIVSRVEPGLTGASSLLGKYGFGGEPGLTCASSLNGKYSVVKERGVGARLGSKHHASLWACHY